MVNGDRYEGNYKDDKMNGYFSLFSLAVPLLFGGKSHGKYFYADGTSFEGEWKDDQRDKEANPKA